MTNQEILPTQKPNQGFVVGEHEYLLAEDDNTAMQSLLEEAGQEPDPIKRHEAETEVALLGIHLAIEALVNQNAEVDIASAKSANIRGRRIAEEAQEIAKTHGIAMLAGGKVGWLASNGPLSVPVERQTKKEANFWLGTIIDKNSATRSAFEHLQDEGVDDKLMETLSGSVLPSFLVALKAGKGNLRPVSKGTRGMKHAKPERSLDTEYPAYKLDVQGTNYRAIIILPGKREHEEKQEHVIILAALYDHGDQPKIMNSLFGKVKKK